MRKAAGERQQMLEEKVESKEFEFYKMHKRIMHFFAVGSIPVEREKLVLQEREEGVVECCLSADDLM